MGPFGDSLICPTSFQGYEWLENQDVEHQDDRYHQMATAVGLDRGMMDCIQLVQEDN